MPTGTESAPVEVLTAAPAATSQPQPSSQEIAQELLERARAEARHQEECAAFHRANYRKAVAYALKLVDGREEAEDLVSQTYLELLKGQTNTQQFFNALRCNCLNRIESAKRQSEVILRVGELREERAAESDATEEMDDESFLESISSRRDRQDPAGILAYKEQLELAMKLVREDSRYRWVRQKKWWKELERRSEMALRAEK